MDEPKVDVIIPLYKPGRELFTLLDRLLCQTVAVNRIILVNTERKYFEELTRGTGFLEKYGAHTVVLHISEKEFDHGGTRRMAAKKSDAAYFVMMTQDALPADKRLLENLLEALKDETVAAAYARQLPAKGCRAAERLSRAFNYPAESRIKRAEDVKELGIKAFFCSNVCAAYRKSTYVKLGGFIPRAIFNEDMVYAAGALAQGYGIAYAAGARVFHSHNYTNMQQFKRNFDLGVSQADHPEVFCGVSSEKEGKRLVAATSGYLLRTGRPGQLLYFYVQCACKYAGYFLGKRYKKLPGAFVRLCTSNAAYWEQAPAGNDFA